MILNLRGPSGSGKSTVGHALIDMFAEGQVEELWEPSMGRKRQVPIAYRLPGDLIVLGRYRARGGGCDGIMPPAVILTDLIEYYRQEPFIYFEALIVSSSRHPWFDYALAHPEQDWVFGFMDTPSEKCIKRVLRRNGGRAIKGDLIAQHARTIQNVKRSAQAIGLHAIDIDHMRALRQVIAIYEAAGWQHGIVDLEAALQRASAVGNARQAQPAVVRRTAAQLEESTA